MGSRCARPSPSVSGSDVPKAYHSPSWPRITAGSAKVSAKAAETGLVYEPGGVPEAPPAARTAGTAVRAAGCEAAALSRQTPATATAAATAVREAGLIVEVEPFGQACDQPLRPARDTPSTT